MRESETVQHEKQLEHCISIGSTSTDRYRERRIKWITLKHAEIGAEMFQNFAVLKANM